MRIVTDSCDDVLIAPQIVAQKAGDMQAKSARNRKNNPLATPTKASFPA